MMKTRGSTLDPSVPRTVALQHAANWKHCKTAAVIAASVDVEQELLVSRIDVHMPLMTMRLYRHVSALDLSMPRTMATCNELKALLDETKQMNDRDGLSCIVKPSAEKPFQQQASRLWCHL